MFHYEHLFCSLNFHRQLDSTLKQLMCTYSISWLVERLLIVCGSRQIWLLFFFFFIALWTFCWLGRILWQFFNLTKALLGLVLTAQKNIQGLPSPDGSLLSNTVLIKTNRSGNPADGSQDKQTYCSKKTRDGLVVTGEGAEPNKAAWQVYVTLITKACWVCLHI